MNTKNLGDYSESVRIADEDIYLFENRYDNPTEIFKMIGELIRDADPPAKNGSLLDVGCGTGIFCHTARSFGWEPSGLDEAEDAVTFARTQYGLDVQLGNFETLDLERKRSTS